MPRVCECATPKGLTTYNWYSIRIPVLLRPDPRLTWILQLGGFLYSYLLISKLDVFRFEGSYIWRGYTRKVSTTLDFLGQAWLRLLVSGPLFAQLSEWDFSFPVTSVHSHKLTVLMYPPDWIWFLWNYHRSNCSLNCSLILEQSVDRRFA